MSRAEVADHFNVDPKTVYRWGKKDILNPIIMGKTVRYDRDVVMAYSAKKVMSATSSTDNLQAHISRVTKG